jgi:cell wall assembly regulator SMI1
MIDLVEEVLQAKLPLVIRKFYLRHDGSGDFTIGPINEGGCHVFLALRQVVNRWRNLSEIGKDFELSEGDFGEQDGPIKRHHWHRRWIPVAENGGGDCIFLDLDPAIGGSRGQIIDWWHERGRSTWLASSFDEWLQGIVDAVKKGKMEAPFDPSE